ncbi:hypothetical protein LguiA_020619 [Lonicera macranthoides]
MGQQSLIYSFAARGTVILAEYTEFTGNFTSIASQCLQKLPATNNKFTYNCDGHTFNYLVEDGFIFDDSSKSPKAYWKEDNAVVLMVYIGVCTPAGGSFGYTDLYTSMLYKAEKEWMRWLAYCVVAIESAGRQVPMAFLERIKEDFTKRYGGGKAATAVANSLNKEFGPKLKEQMQYCIDHPEEISKLAKVKAQVLDRGEKIELLVDKTENLRSQVLFACPSIGTRFQDPRNKDEEEDVVTKHEGKADSSGNYYCLDPHHSSIGLWRLQM